MTFFDRLPFLYPCFKGCFASSAVALLLILLVQTTYYSQSSEFFDVRSIIREVKVRYGLNSADIRRVGPVIKEENQDVLIIYSRFVANEDQYPSSLWREMIRRRADFEARINEGFNRRQRTALRTARSSLERRVLNYLTEDYVNYLGGLLELDSLQLEAVGSVLAFESRRKHRLIMGGVLTLALQTQLDKVAADTNRAMKTILSSDQFRTYRSQFAADDSLIG